MEKSLSFFALLVILLLLSSIKNTSSSPLPNSTTDENALLALKNTITLDPNATLAQNWSSGNTTSSVCDWIGVTCGNKHQRVTSLNISGFALSGTLPPHLGNLTFLRSFDISSNDFTGPIPSELSRLHRLRYINMVSNSLAGELPSWLGSLPRLEQLLLQNNTFSGRIPEEIGNCTTLQILGLHYNQLTGTIPSDMCDNLPNLTTLALFSNQIEGQIPPNIWKCRGLELLDLSSNRFSGEIPSEIGRLSMLRELYLGKNDLTGGVPRELGNLGRLEILKIAQASLKGELPQELGNLSVLKILSVGNNHLSGSIPSSIFNISTISKLGFIYNQFSGKLPQELENLAFLEIFNVGHNFLSGTIPSSIFNISTLKSLELSDNQFSGSIPSKVPIFNLEELRLDTNKLNGMIPSSFTNSSKLTVLQLDSNEFSGSMPNFSNLRLLRRLYIWDNNLRGTDSSNQELRFISSLSDCQFLEELEIGGNPLNGILPASVGNLSTSLTDFYASDGNITGVIPSTIGNLSNLIRLFINGNQLTGFIPLTVWKLKKLQGLYLDGNQLQGYIPPNLCGLSNIVDLYLDNNILTGPIPECLGDVQSLLEIYLGSNLLNSTIPSRIWNLTNLLILNLSSNYLTGQISYEIARLKVISLDLSHNKFYGNIPSSIDSCKSLQILDLSNNNLSGLIPKSLESLSLLQYFNVSYNKLEGEIPTGGPFINFTAQSFFNNSALCGEPRFHIPHCINKDDISRSRLNKVGRLMKYILPPFILVFIVATITILVLAMRQKHKNVPVLVDISPGVTWRRTSYLDLVRGTNGFSESNLLGKGSFGSVFKATLSDGLIVAVKVFDSYLERAVLSFNTECEILSNIRHRNLVQIIGCCSNTEFKALILGYMLNGSLEKWLYTENYCLDLIQRLKILIDVALALEYLHHGQTFPVVHCDIKPSNVLLDEDMVAHLADFGISKFFDDGETMVQTKTFATIGYAAPEYGSEGKVSTNGDVYSYGILLLEVFTKKKPTNDMFSEEMSLSRWVGEALQGNAVSEVVAPDLLASEEEDQNFRAKVEECLSSILRLAMKCLAVSPDERINMIETVGTLQRIRANIIANTTGCRKYA